MDMYLVKIVVINKSLVTQAKGFPSDSVVKKPSADVEDTGLIPKSGRLPGKENGCPLQYSCWEILWTEEPSRYSL